MQARMRKLRIFPGEEHPFKDDPRLVPWTMPPRKLKVKEGIFEVPDGFEPLNPRAYQRRFGHLLPEGRLGHATTASSNSLVPRIATQE